MITKQDLKEAQDALEEAEDELRRCGLSNLGIRWLERDPCPHTGELYCAIGQWLKAMRHCKRR